MKPGIRGDTGRSAFRRETTAAIAAKAAPTVVPSAWRLKRLLYWLLPAVILGIVFSRIDLATLGYQARRANTGTLLGALSLFPLFMILGGLRWNRATRRYCRAPVPLTFSIQHYWIGQALGLFAPGSLGWDAYRALVAGKHYGHYLMNAAVILVEKLLALLACVTLVSMLAPFVSVAAPLLREIISWAHLLGWGVTGALLLAIYFSRLPLIRVLALKAESYIRGLAARALERPPAKTPDRLFDSVMEPLRSPGLLLELLLLSFAILGLSAGINQLLFQSLGQPVPFLVNLFLAPVFYFLFVLPISVGGIGVREASYIALYGLFGVPAETALLVGFLVFCGDLFNTLIGAALLYANKPPGNDLPRHT